MDPIWIVVAFIFGFAVKQIGLPPLVGFLMAGFALNVMGIKGGETLDNIADLGVMLLLFSIGLKLKIKSLFRPEIWAGATLHMMIIVALFGLGLFLLSYTGLSLFTGMSFGTSILIAFALSFSSTVFAVKILEEQNAMAAPHGRTAIGILIMQDILAVIFLTFSSGKYPSPWSLVLIALILVPLLLKKVPPLSAIINRSGHGELLVLLGVLIPFGAAALFNIVGLKADLGALIIGVLLSGHPKAKELSNAMLSFKDLFLVGFFLSIGISGLPDLQALVISFVLALAVPVKIVFFFLLLTRFKLRARTALLSSLSLANYSEFGLIVGAAGAANGWLNQEWLIIFAISLSISFVLASPLNIASNSLYKRWHIWLQKFETKTRLPEDMPIYPGNTEIIILGMGRIGTEVYRVLTREYKRAILGIDYNNEVVNQQLSANRNVIQGDAADSDFWERVQPSVKLGLVILATSNHSTHMQVIDQLKACKNEKTIAAICQYDDEIEELKEAGVKVVFNLYAEAGAGYAEHICQMLEQQN